MEIALLWLAMAGLVTWWASVWGRSVGFALLGSLILSPLIWAVVLLVLGRNDQPALAAPGAPARAPSGHLGPIVGSTVCPECRAPVTLRQRQVDAGCFTCDSCGKTSDLAAKRPDPAQGGAVRIANAGGADAHAICPGCGGRVAVTFDDAKAGRATCPACWRAFDIAAG